MSSPPVDRAPGSTDGDTERHARRNQLSTARAAARAFFDTYVRYLSGRLTAGRVANVSPTLRVQIESGRPETTPAERASHPRIGSVHVAIAGPPVSVTAVAHVETGRGQGSQLPATLEPAGQTWHIVAAGG